MSQLNREVIKHCFIVRENWIEGGLEAYMNEEGGFSQAVAFDLGLKEQEAIAR